MTLLTALWLGEILPPALFVLAVVAFGGALLWMRLLGRRQDRVEARQYAQYLAIRSLMQVNHEREAMEADVVAFLQRQEDEGEGWKE